jgi:hypothetical protein
MEGYKLHSCGSGLGQVAGSCVDGKELLPPIEWGGMI